jgi:hypothetical protein
MIFLPNIRQIVIALLILMISLSTIAQEDDITAWTIEERCITAPSAIPDDWSYSGTILMSGYAGIHGVRMDWETPHVVAFFRSSSHLDAPMIGGQISPDGRWYALPFGETFLEVSNNYYNFVNGWRVYSTSGDQQLLEFYLSDYQDIYRYDAAAWTYLPIEWADNESLIIGGILSHPFKNTVEVAAFDTLVGGKRQFIAPDMEYAYGDILQDDAYQFGLYRLSDPLASFLPLGEIAGISWRRDSLGFMAMLSDETQSWNGLVYYDNNGTLIEYVFNAADNFIRFPQNVSGRNDLQWSYESRYFAFVLEQWSEPNRLYIVDFENQLVVDTCLSPASQPIWSPDTNLLAYVSPARENLKVIVVDLQLWHAFDVARHSGRDSRMPEIGHMVGWRADD